MKKLLVLVAFLVLYACMIHAQLPIPEFKYGVGTLSGKILGNIPKEQKTETLNIRINRIGFDNIGSEIPIEDNGTFSFNIPIFTVSLCVIESPIYSGLIYLLPNENTKLNISFDNNGEKHVSIENSLSPPFNYMNMGDKLLEICMGKDFGVDVNDYNITPNEYALISKKALSNILEKLEERSDLSENLKLIMGCELKALFSNFYILNYSQTIKNKYKLHDDESNYTPTEPDISYYSILKYLKLNNPYYLYSPSYQILIQNLLNTNNIGIPPIDMYSLEVWKDKTDSIVKYIIDNDHSFFDKMLILNAYTKQLNELKPLSGSQKEDIKSYYKEEAFSEMLFTENSKVIKLIQSDSSSKDFKINETPKVSKELLISTILQKYEGKVVFIDFWATWCGPCLKNMKQIEPVKKELTGKDVVFVYITNDTSVRKTWEEKVSQIGGEHYYLDEKTWDYLKNDLQLIGVPTYLIYDKSGALKHKSNSMEPNKMRKWINELL